MTIPTRPAPVPPQMRSSAASDANSSIEQLRLQLQQQQLQQQQQKLTIKLPPPPKGITSANHFSTFPHKTSNLHNNNNYNNNNNSNYNELDTTTTTSITRKFPKARYAPATNWDDTPFDPFESVGGGKTNGNVKKVPPPRPPPPKLLVNGQQKPTNTSSSSASTKIISNLFHRKKANNTNKQRIYGLSSGNFSNSQTHNDSMATVKTTTPSSSVFTNSDWNAAWDSTTTNYASASTIITTTKTTTTTTNSSQNHQEAQLISFDSPPSSPTFTQKSNSDCVSVDSFSSDSNFSSPQNGSVSQPESGFEDDFSATSRSRPATTSPLDPWESYSGSSSTHNSHNENLYCSTATIGTAPVRNIARATASTQDNPLCNGRNVLPPPPSVSMPTIIKPKISQKPKAPRPPIFGLPKQHQFGERLNSDLPTPPSPPMPQCSPPPPPPTVAATSTSTTTGTATGSASILDVIMGKADAMQLSSGAMGYNNESHEIEAPYGIALYDFDGAEEGDLSFRENEKIYLLERVSEEWYRGRTRAGCEGILPVNYIEIKVPLPAEASSKNHNLSSNSSLPKVRCLYNFPAEVQGDLALKENDMVTILYRINEDWLFGEINNRQGQFPANFLEYVPTNIPLP